MNLKKKIIILCTIGVLLIIGALFANKFIGQKYFKSLTYDEVINKLENKETFVLCVSQTTCNHCQSYKPKLSKVANKYKLNVYYIDIDLLTKEEQKDFGKYINLSSGTPSTVFIKEGEERTVANRIIGDQSTEEIIKRLTQQGFIER